MNILIAPDKFKGSLSALEVCLAIEQGIHSMTPDANTIIHPLADGGEASLEIMKQYMTWNKIKVKTVNPIGQEINSHYYRDDNIAFIELASASGLKLISKIDQNPMNTSTLGTGIMMRHAINAGCETINLFLGGSATNDGGIGIAAALGYRFYDRNGEEVYPCGKNLIHISDINDSQRISKSIKITCYYDVSNPLLGNNGASKIYAEQKGAQENEILFLEKGLIHYSQLIKSKYDIDITTIKSGGAAGGVAAGMYALCGAVLKPGLNSIMQWTDFESKLSQADLIITGEGQLDKQTLEGKVVQGVIDLCHQYKKPYYIFVGKNKLGTNNFWKNSPIQSIIDLAKDEKDAMTNANVYLAKMAAQLMRIKK